MATLRDWPRTLRRASYRGASFFVEHDQVSTGRRLVVHEFPMRDTPYVEDLGREANKVEITAYVLGDTADAAEKALRRACESGGAASLVLPLERLTAHCEKCSRTFAKDKLGYIAFSLTFVREGVANGLFPVPFLRSLVGLAATALRAPLTSLFLSSFQGLRVAGFVTATAITEIRNAAATFDAAIATSRLDANVAPQLARAAQDLYDDAAALSQVGATADRLDPRAYVAAAETALTAPLVDRLVDLAQGLADAAAPEVAIAALAPAAQFGLDADALPRTTASRLREHQNREALFVAVRLAALGATATAYARQRHADRRSAIAARADAAELFGAELERLSSWRDHAVVVAVDELRGATIDVLSRQIADLAPVIAVEAARTLPSLWWAHRLYGDPLRAGELVARNRIKHPSFMPVVFEALAR